MPAIRSKIIVDEETRSILPLLNLGAEGFAFRRIHVGQPVGQGGRGKVRGKGRGKGEGGQAGHRGLLVYGFARDHDRGARPSKGQAARCQGGLGRAGNSACQRALGLLYDPAGTVGAKDARTGWDTTGRSGR